MKKAFMVVAAILLPSSLAAQAAETAEKQAIEQMKDQIARLQKRIDTLEQDAKTAADKADKSSAAFDDRAARKSPEVRESQIERRESFNDQQEAAARVYDVTLDPTYSGFIPIPHTPVIIRFNAQPRVDLSLDNTYTGNDNRFVTSLIPVNGESERGGGSQFNFNAQGSRLSMDVRAPGTAGEPRFFYENDFAGGGSGYLEYRVRHLYGQMFNVVIGQTYTVFEDPDAWPDTVDYEGPNAAISARRPLIRYMLAIRKEWVINFSLEKSDSQVDTFGFKTAESENHYPDGGINVRWARKGVGHVHLATIFRGIGVSDDIFGNQTTFGWGINFSANLHISANNSFQTQVTYGQGVYSFLNDAVESDDAAFNANSTLVALPVIGVMAGITHNWSPTFRSTASFGFANLENAASQAWNAYHRTYYGSVNFVYQLYRRLAFGLEGLYGYKEVKNGSSGDAFRVQLTVMYSLF